MKWSNIPIRDCTSMLRSFEARHVSKSIPTAMAKEDEVVFQR